MKGLVNGDILRALYIAQVRRLRVEEKYLLIAAYLAANNPTKFDLKLFGNVGRGARVRKQNQKTIIKTHNKGLRMIPKIFPLDRLMAIFYYIVNCSPIPSLYTVQTSIHNLTEQQLLYRVTNMAKLDMPKFRCHLPIDFISLISRDVTFDITKYLIISNQ